MTKNKNHIITYEIIAMLKETEASLFLSEGFDHKVFQVSILNLPLYIHLPKKSLNFDRLLKGEPLEKSKEICQWDISTKSL
jgi:hypothetical protein